MTDENRLGRRVPGWKPPPLPPRNPITGQCVRLEPLRAPVHAQELHAAFDGHPALWDYMPYGPFADAAAYRDWVAGVEDGADPLFFAIRDLSSGRAAGVASYLRIAPVAGSIEVGHICLSPALQRSRAATEAMTLMMRCAFDLGYRRYEWKCNALNLASRRAAQRLGFSFEGVFRQAAVVKGRNRDTAWFAITDADWRCLAPAYDRWLDPTNFDAAGRQKVPLGGLTGPCRVAVDPALGADLAGRTAVGPR